MKSACFAVVALLGICVAAPTWAQSSLSSWSYEQNLVGAAMASDVPHSGYAHGDVGYGTSPYCSGACDAGCDACYGSCCDGPCDFGPSCCGGADGLLSDCSYLDGVEAFKLAGFLDLDSAGFDLGGWSQFGYHSDTTPLSRTAGDGLSFNDVPDRFNLQQQWIYLARQADGSRGFDIGGRVDVVYGTDAQKTQSFGNPPGSFDESWDHGSYGWAIPQLYAEAASGDFSVIVGHFFTLVGYEVVTAPDNFFYSHSLTMFNSEPFTHTGALFTYTGFDSTTVYGGWTAGWDTGFDSVDSGSNFLGGFSVDLLDSVTLTYITTIGNFGQRSMGHNGYSHSAVLDVTLLEGLSYVFQTDLVTVEATGDDDVGVNQYLFYTLNDYVSLGQRIEWWSDDGDSHAESTTGVNIQALGNLVFRPEYRKDWLGGFDTDIFGCDMILTY